MAETFIYDVFLSHSSQDKEVVRDVAKRLRANELRVWFDELEIKPADSLSPGERARVRAAKVEEGLEHSRVLLLCMSKNALESGSETVPHRCAEANRRHVYSSRSMSW